MTAWRGIVDRLEALAGFITGPASSVNGDIAIFSGTTGQIIADSGKTIASLGPGGTNTQLQYNNSGAFGGTSATYDNVSGEVTFPDFTFLTGNAAVNNLQGTSDLETYLQYDNSGNLILGDVFGNYADVNMVISNSNNQIQLNYNNDDPDNPVAVFTTTSTSGIGQVGMGWVVNNDVQMVARADYVGGGTFNCKSNFTIATGGLIGDGAETTAWTFDTNSALYNNVNNGIVYFEAWYDGTGHGGQAYLGDGAGYGANTYVLSDDFNQQVYIKANNGFLYGPTAQENWAAFGASTWFESGSPWTGAQQNNVIAFTTQDSQSTTSQYPYGFGWGFYPDSSGNPVPTMTPTQFGISYLPFYMNTNTLVVGGAFATVPWSSAHVLEIYDTGQNLAFSINATTDASAFRGVVQAGGYKSSDGSAGDTTTVTTSSLAGKTMTFKNGLLVSFA